MENGWVAGFLDFIRYGGRANWTPCRQYLFLVRTWKVGSLVRLRPEMDAGNCCRRTDFGRREGTDVDAYGFRQYEFNISAVAGNTKPPLDAGEKLATLVLCRPFQRQDRSGALLPLTDGTPDGWSGIPVMYGHQLPPGESVEIVRYYAAETRGSRCRRRNSCGHTADRQAEDGSEDGDGFFSIHEVGPTHIPEETGRMNLRGVVNRYRMTENFIIQPHCSG